MYWGKNYNITCFFLFFDMWLLKFLNSLYGSYLSFTYFFGQLIGAITNQNYIYNFIQEKTLMNRTKDSSNY